MVEFEQDEDIAILTIAHGKANALDTELCTSLSEQFARLTNEDAVSAVILTGQGTIFSAGVDLLRILAGSADYTRQFIPTMTAMLRAAFTFPKPLVVAVNGHAIAGGFIIACTGDRRLMVRGQSRVGVPELRVGVPFPDVAMEILRHALTPVQLKEMVWSGASYDAQVALARGLIDEIVEPGALHDRAITVARELAMIRSEIFRFTKLQMRRPALGRLSTLDSDLEAATVDAWASAAAAEAIRDYVNRTLKRSGAGDA